MAITKLTLSADKELIQEAKKLAAENGTSVSALFARLLRAMTHAGGSQEGPGPLTRKATGLIRLPRSVGDEQLLGEALTDKYGARK